MTTPRTLALTIRLFGNPALPDGSLDRAWERANIVSMPVPAGYPLFYAGKRVRRIRIHKLLAPSLQLVFLDIWNDVRTLVKRRYGYDQSTAWYDNRTRETLAEFGLDQYSGSYVFRRVRRGKALSNHAFGIAIDMDAAHNQQGTEGRMPLWAVEVFEKRGWQWGGRTDVFCSELEALAFGSDLARGTMVRLIVNEYDSAPLSDTEWREKVRVMLSRGISPAIIHWSLEEMKARASLIAEVSAMCQQAPRVRPETPLEVRGTLGRALVNWRQLGGSVEKSVPVRWRFASHGPDNE